MNNRQLFQHYVAQTSPFPLELEITDSEGLYLIGNDGRRYVDMISGIGVSVIGHKHPNIVNAITAQVNKFMHTMVYGEHILSPQTQLAAHLVNLLPKGLDNIYWTNSGTEAVEGGLKLAKKYTGRFEIVACKNAYHGSSQGAAALMSNPEFSGVTKPHVPGVSFINFNNLDDLNRITTRTAAVITEVIQAESGLTLPTIEFLTALRARCTETGTLLIFDEIQSGIGRTGHWFACQKYNVTPDILLAGKAIGGGLPLAAFISSKTIMQSISHSPILSHITTFGGNPVCCAASKAVLETLETEQLIEQITKKENIIIDLLSTANLTFRTAGLWAAIELNNFDQVQKTCLRLMDKGILIDWFLFNSHAIRIAPPLIITEQELANNLELIIDMIRQVCQ